MKKIIIISCLIAVAAAFNSCTKDDDPEASNPYNGKTTAQFNPDIIYGSMTDQDGNVYKTITLGGKKSGDGTTVTWMAENLRTTKYNDGTSIPNVTGTAAWEGLTTGAFCTYKNTTKPDSIATFGLLYNYYTIETNKLAPQGWHLPTNEDLTRLRSLHGSYTTCGGFMKEKGTTHWAEPNYLGSNVYGFTALPSGHRHFKDGFNLLGTTAVWWIDKSINNYAFSFYVGANGGEVYENQTDKRFGYSIRLVKD
jgi:uncharacterized protein (TIGR02145 family)